MANYRGGRAKEYEVINKYLKPQGFKCTRSAGSHGTWDIISWKGSNEMKFIQVKKQKDPKVRLSLYKKDIAQMLADQDVPASSATLTVSKELWVFPLRKPLTILPITEQSLVQA